VDDLARQFAFASVSNRDPFATGQAQLPFVTRLASAVRVEDRAIQANAVLVDTGDVSPAIAQSGVLAKQFNGGSRVLG
jgi:hypothetical protein